MMKFTAQLVYCILFISITTISYANVQQELAKLEANSKGRIGIAALNMADNTQINYRASERFPMGCTSKILGVGAVLKASMTQPVLLTKKIKYQQKDLTFWCPITKNHLTEGMTVEELSAAAISYSDNTAMNLLVTELGGIDSLNTFARSIKQPQFKFNNMWPAESYSGPEGNDSTTPAAMTATLKSLTIGDVLATKQRQLLITWLKNNTTGNARIRASVPQGWVVGDKTGTGSIYGTTNDTAIIWPPKKQPILLTVFYTSADKDAVVRNDVVAAAARIVLRGFEGHQSN